MREKYTLNGRITEDGKTIFNGQLDLRLSEHSISIHRHDRLGKRLHVSPFHGGMFFGPTHSEGCEILANGYQLSISGAMIGSYEQGGGGPDGDFDIFKIKDAEIRGSYDHAGLNVSISANTLPGFAICYNTHERQDGIYAPIEVVVEFLVPPNDLPDFLMLRLPLDHHVFAPFSWPRG